MQRGYRRISKTSLEAAGAAREFVAGMGKDELARDRRARDAVVRNLEIIGEAAKKLPAQRRRDHPEVEWKKIAGLRDILSTTTSASTWTSSGTSFRTSCRFSSSRSSVS
jgi:uncharacterized protein with HEPN domain